jgi:hypothetical protein
VVSVEGESAGSFHFAEGDGVQNATEIDTACAT